jgi:signal transduction histidine kinase
MVSIGATATMVGHDLRNPLQVVFMLTDLIQKRLQWIKKEETREIEDIVNLIERIKNQATYMNKIVSDLQGLTEGIRLDIEDVNIIDLVQEVLETIQFPDNIEEKMFFEEDFPEIYADKNKLKRVFTNLITNAVQAMTNGGELVIKGFRLEDEVYISIVDTGCGISEECLDNIFDPLFTTKARGTGLGLTVCKRIAEANGGKIVAKSHSGIGSCFTVVLPVNRKLESVDQNPEAFMDYETPQSHILPLSLV